MNIKNSKTFYTKTIIYIIAILYIFTFFFLRFNGTLILLCSRSLGSNDYYFIEAKNNEKYDTPFTKIINTMFYIPKSIESFLRNQHFIGK